MNAVIFHDRRHAGKLLAKQLAQYGTHNPLILGIPRGGVVVAAEVANVLACGLDVIVARKIAAPGDPEYAIGAIAPGDVAVFNQAALQSCVQDQSQLDNVVANEQKEMQRRTNLYRKGKGKLNLAGRIVIVVDDGLATGLTATAAVRAVCTAGAKETVLAVPVSSTEARDALISEVDCFISLHTLDYFTSVGYYYENFRQVTDAEVLDLLAE